MTAKKEKNPDFLVIGKARYKRIPYGSETRFGKKELREILKDYPLCSDCHAAKGELHSAPTNYYGEFNCCDIEDCPKCHGQLLSCGCLSS